MSRHWDMEKLICCVKLTKGQSMSQKVNVPLTWGWVSTMKPTIASHSMTISCVSISWYQQPGKHTLFLGSRGWTYILYRHPQHKHSCNLAKTTNCLMKEKDTQSSNCNLCDKCSPRGVDKLLWDPAREIWTLYRRDFKNRKCDIWARLKEAWSLLGGEKGKIF